MWIVQVSAIVVTLAVAASVALVCSLCEDEGHSQEDGSAGLELAMEDGNDTVRNNGTNAITAAAMSGIPEFLTKSTNVAHAPEAT